MVAIHGRFYLHFLFWEKGRGVVVLAAFISLLGAFVHGSRGSPIKPPDDGSTLPVRFHKPPPRNWDQHPAPLPAHLISFHKPHGRRRSSIPAPAPAPLHSISSHMRHVKKRASSHASTPSHFSSPPSYHRGHVLAPSHPPTVPLKKSRHKQHGSPPLDQGGLPLSPIQSPFSSKAGKRAAAPSSSITVPSHPLEGPVHSPRISPSVPFTRKQRKPVRTLPPPPPNQDCSKVRCTEPLTNTLVGSPCGCVWPMKVGLRLNVALYTFFPLVSELAQEIAAGIFLNQSQVRIMGANAASQEPDKTAVFIDLVPFGDKFNHVTALLAYEKFWHKKVPIKASFFGDYEVLYVQYPGLPPPPPASPINVTIDGQLSANNKPRAIRPLGVDIRKRKERLDGSVIAIIALSSSVLLVLCIGAVWLLLYKCGTHTRELPSNPQTSLPLGKQLGAVAGPGSMIFGSGPSSSSLSLSSSIAVCAGSAKTFSLAEIEKATDDFKSSRILGEGGFGRVYRGSLEDGTKVAVKVLKRDDHQGGREFLAEVEMLSRLHHRNLVKLIGICTEEHSHCLIYELIPNGSVESHLHGANRETSPLDWHARMKIALGAARGLAYLHEDSSPRVIHRDFKSSNILLENDFTPKVSDFGLARTALDGGSEHISTRVMGTFGYVAPEYAMTGHLLVKSDVYSYGVVLLELLTGRKPIDMSQPPGQENLVAWARPFLTSKDGLETIIDSALGPDFPFDSMAKVAAIASMCVQPEVSHRPFMGEVVQALQLVCNECDENKGCSGSFSHKDSSAQDTETKFCSSSGLLPEPHSFLTASYDSGLEAERALSTSDIFNAPSRLAGQDSRSFRRHSTSGPLRTRDQNVQYLSRGRLSASLSEHGVALKSLIGLGRRGRWL